MLPDVQVVASLHFWTDAIICCPEDKVHPLHVQHHWRQNGMLADFASRAAHESSAMLSATQQMLTRAHSAVPQAVLQAESMRESLLSLHTAAEVRTKGRAQAGSFRLLSHRITGQENAAAPIWLLILESLSCHQHHVLPETASECQPGGTTSQILVKSSAQPLASGPHAHTHAHPILTRAG